MVKLKCKLLALLYSASLIHSGVLYANEVADAHLELSQCIVSHMDKDDMIVIKRALVSALARDEAIDDVAMLFWYEKKSAELAKAVFSEKLNQHCSSQAHKAKDLDAVKFMQLLGVFLSQQVFMKMLDNTKVSETIYDYAPYYSK